MNFWTRERQIRDAASFMWCGDKRGPKGVWFTPPALTEANNIDPANPIYSPDDANEIFRELERRELITPSVKPFVDPANNKIFGVGGFIINHNRDAEWTELMGKRGLWQMQIAPAIYSILGGNRFATVRVAIGVVVAAYFGAIAKKGGDATYDLISEAISSKPLQQETKPK